MTTPKILRSIRFLIATSFKASAKLTIGVVALSVLTGALSPLNAAFIRLLVDGAIAGHVLHVVIALGGLGFATALSWLFVAHMLNMYFTLMDRTGFLIDQEMLAMTTQLPGLEHHENPEYQDKLSLLREQRGQFSSAIEASSNALRFLTTIITSVGLLASVDPLLLLLFPFALPRLWAASKSTSIVQRAHDENAERVRSATSLFKVATTAEAGKELRVFGLSSELIQRYKRLRDLVDKKLARTEFRAELVSIGSRLIFAFAYAGGIAIVVLRALSGRAGPGDVVMALTLAAQISGIVEATGGNLSYVRRSLAIVSRYLWLTDYASARRARPQASRNVPVAIKEGIRFEGVGFRYPGTSLDVLHGIDLIIPAGTTLAIVGENGAGKTTLVKLLCRFYEPTSGRITLDGEDVSLFDLSAWRELLSGGFQDFAKFEYLLRENVGVGDLPRMASDDAVLAALNRAHAQDVPSALPSGLNTQLGRRFPNGVEPSVGQWQKLALGRAMMRQAPLLLILDEPTASLDAQTEHALFERYAAAARYSANQNGAITVLVSHRFSTVKMADLIVVLHEGRLIDAGSHEQLIARGGLYQELYELQAKSYK